MVAQQLPLNIKMLNCTHKTIAETICGFKANCVQIKLRTDFQGHLFRKLYSNMGDYTDLSYIHQCKWMQGTSGYIPLLDTTSSVKT